PVGTGSPRVASFRVSYGQARTHRPQRTQAARKSSSASAPGGRSAVGARALAWLPYSPTPNPSTQAPPIAAADCCRKRRRLCLAGGFGRSVIAVARARAGRRSAPLTSGLEHLDGALLEVRLFRERAGGVQDQLVDQASLVEERHEHQAARRLVAAAGFHAGHHLAAPRDDARLHAALQPAGLGI